MTEPVVAVKYDGVTLITVDQGCIDVLKRAVESTRLRYGSILVESRLDEVFRDKDEKIKAGSVNPWRDNVLSPERVYNEIPVTKRRGMTRRDITTVLDTVARLAWSKTQ